MQPSSFHAPHIGKTTRPLRLSDGDEPSSTRWRMKVNLRQFTDERRITNERTSPGASSFCWSGRGRKLWEDRESEDLDHHLHRSSSLQTDAPIHFWPFLKGTWWYRGSAYRHLWTAAFLGAAVFYPRFPQISLEASRRAVSCHKIVSLWYMMAICKNCARRNQFLEGASLSCGAVGVSFNSYMLRFLLSPEFSRVCL